MPVVYTVGTYQKSGSVTSPLIRFEPRLAMKLGSITDDMRGRKIRRAIHKAIYKGFDQAIDETIAKGKKIVPESVGRDYPPSYNSEKLMKSWIAHMKKEAAKVSKGTNTIKATYEITEEWAASYAEYVSNMDKVKWTKRGSKSNFIEILHRFLVRAILKNIRRNVKGMSSGGSLWGK